MKQINKKNTNNNIYEIFMDVIKAKSEVKQYKSY